MSTDLPSSITGLTAAEIAQRTADGRVNTAQRGPDRSFGQILRANMFNPVNGIMLTLFALIMIAGFPNDALFVGVVISNTVIGIAQELRARRELRKLEILNAPQARVIRDGVTAEIAIDEIVADDVVDLASGDQVVVDAEVLDATGLELDESLLTGESDTIVKSVGDGLLSGSFVVAGHGLARATGVGAASYANQLTVEATAFKLVQSELRRGINTILHWLMIIIPPASLLLLWSLLSGEGTWQEGLQGTVAAAVAMVPDGLVLLTSLAFMAGVIALARRKALAKELATVELLARVDTLCLDKTGTITTGEISFGGIIPLGDASDDEARHWAGAVAHCDPRPNPTMVAVQTAIAAPDELVADEVEPFSSSRKWAAARFPDGTCVWMGAPDIVLADDDELSRRLATEESAKGKRVLAVVATEGGSPGELPERPRPVALVVLEDTVRPDAHEILSYFVAQDVELRIISGDNVATVAAVAERAGVPGTDRSIDARTLSEDPEELARVVEDTVVFGRVAPHQKRAMVQALQRNGRVVGMTGDGVNDVLALKNADMGIAMGSGSPASRAAADLVLLDNRFATLPKVLDEGRKVINNVERVSSLFVTKAAYAVLLAAVIGIAQAPFPLLPRHLTLIGTFSIGVPGFFLALAPTTDLVRPGFLRRVLRFSIPAGIAAGTAALVVYAIAYNSSDVTLEQARTATTITLLTVGLVILVTVSRPLRLWKLCLAGSMAASYTVVMYWAPLREFFELDRPPLHVFLPIGVSVAVAGFVVVLTGAVVERNASRPSAPDRRTR